MGYPPQGNALMKKGVWGNPPQGKALKKKDNMKKAGKTPAFACLKDYLEAKLPK